MSKLNSIFCKPLGMLLVLSLFAISTTSLLGQLKNDIKTNKFKIGGSLRLRGESKTNYNFFDSKQDYFLTQLRINFNWQPTEWMQIFVEGQDSRVYGEDLASAPKINNNSTPNIYQDQLDLHQFTVDFKTSISDIPFNLRIGRQKFNLGAQRLVASLEWVNTARVWDGIMFSIGKSSKRKVDVFASQVVPVTPNKFNEHTRTKSRYFNSYFSGIYYTDNMTIINGRLEAYWLFRNEKYADDATHTFGARVHKAVDAFNFGAEAATQYGKYGGLDHNAMMAHLEANYTVKQFNNSTFGIAYNYGSADGDANDDKHNTFDNLYPLNHAYYGYMDLFSLQNIHNVEVTFKTKIASTVNLRLAWQSFWLDDTENDAWYNAGLGVVRKALEPGVDSHVANEIDITLKYITLNKKLVFIAGYSYLLTGKYIEQTGNSANPGFAFILSKYTL